jgi:membrane protein implicated in regulation of membrane protease activity
VDLLAAIEQFAWIGWTVLILLFLVVEMLTLDLTFLMLALGSIAGLVSGITGAPAWSQLIVAAAVAAILLFLLRPPLIRRLHRGEDTTPSNMAALVGLPGRVLATVSPTTGQVKLANGDVWTARSDSRSTLEPGAPVRVIRIDGATAYVHPDIDERESAL